MYRFRAFYLTILCISLFTIASLGTDWAARYRHGTQYGTAQRRALEELDITRLVKRDEEVCKIPKHPFLLLYGLPYAIAIC
jgi:sodium/potassium/calcium exchanger 6